MLAGSVSLLFEFIESRVFFEVLDIGGEICFLFVYFFFFDSACGGLGRDRFRENSGFGALQFLIAAIDFPETEIGQGEAIVRVGKARIHLDRVAVLNGGFTELALFEEALATLKIFLLANVGVTRTAREKAGKQSENEEQAER